MEDLNREKTTNSENNSNPVIIPQPNKLIDEEKTQVKKQEELLSELENALEEVKDPTTSTGLIKNLEKRTPPISEIPTNPIKTELEKKPTETPNLNQVKEEEVDDLFEESSLMRDETTEEINSPILNPNTESFKNETKKITNPTYKNIRTYKDDLAGILKNNKTSMVGAILAEEKKKGSFFSSLPNMPKIEERTKKNTLLLIASLILVVAGITSAVLLYFFRPEPIIKIENVEITPLIYSEYSREIYLDKATKLKLNKLVSTENENTDLPLGTLIHFYITERGYIGEDAKSLIDFPRLNSLLDAHNTQEFLRFIDPNFMFGFYSSFGNQPFLILKTRSFENSFTEMLAWEKDMIEDLRNIFVNDNPLFSNENLRNTSFSFKDVIINNKDTRSVLDGGGKIIFTYAFADKNTIVITTSKEALQEIFNRLATGYRKR
ncbi:MAG: hypothetical protein V1851_01020 [Patescibacteria group bacterium]